MVTSYFVDSSGRFYAASVEYHPELWNQPGYKNYLFVSTPLFYRDCTMERLNCFDFTSSVALRKQFNIQDDLTLTFACDELDYMPVEEETIPA